MYQRYAGLIFDMDGTILDTEPTHRKAWREVLGRYGMRFDEQAVVALNGSPTWRIAQAIIELNQADLDPHRLAQEKTVAVKAMLLDSVRPLPLIEVVKEWHGRRPMSVGTGSESAVAEALLAHLGLRHYFSAVVAADHVAQHKPAPDTFLLCAERMGVAPETCVVSRMPTSVWRRRSARVWMLWMCVCCERRAVAPVAFCQQLFKRHFTARQLRSGAGCYASYGGKSTVDAGINSNNRQ